MPKLSKFNYWVTSYPLDNSTPFTVIHAEKDQITVHSDEFKDVVFSVPAIDIVSIERKTGKTVYVEAWGFGLEGYKNECMTEDELEQLIFDKSLKNVLD